MIGTTGSRCLFTFRDHAPRVGLVLVLLAQAGETVDSEKEFAVLKRAMTEKRERWQNKESYGKTKSRWRQLAGEEGEQSSHEWRSK